MSESHVPESIINRARKLMALRDGATFEGEVSAAASKLQELLATYNIEISQLGAEPTTGDAARTKMDKGVEVRHDWQEELLKVVAKNNFCAVWFDVVAAKRLDGKGSIRLRKRASLIGRRTNVIVTTETFAYLLGAMERLNPYEDRRDRSAKSWFTGCSDTLQTRLNAQRWDAERASRAAKGDAPRGNGTDLVLSDVYGSEDDLNADFRNGYAPGTTARKRAEQEAADAAWWEANKDRIAAQEAARTATPRTPEQERADAKQAERDRKANERWHRAYQRRQERAEARIDRGAYWAGEAAGENIGLDKQVGSEKKNLLG